MNHPFENLLENCPQCQKTWDGHRYAILATQESEGENPQFQAKVEEFLSLLQRAQWNEALKISNFDPTKDTVQAFVVECPDQKLMTAYLLSPFDMMLDSTWLGWDEINEEDSKKLRSLIADSAWKSID